MIFPKLLTAIFTISYCVVLSFHLSNNLLSKFKNVKMKLKLEKETRYHHKNMNKNWSKIFHQLPFLSLSLALFTFSPPPSHSAYINEISSFTNVIISAANDESSNNIVEIVKTPPRKAPRAHVYSVEFTDPPSLLPRTTAGERSAVDRLLGADTVIIGKHYLDNTDSQLEVNILTQMLSQLGSNSKSTFAVGLSSFPNNEKCKQALDSYTQQVDSISSADLMLSLKNAEVDDNDIKDSLSVLTFAHDNKIKVIPLGLSVDTTTTGSQSSAIADTAGFVQSTRGAGFSRYVDLVVKPDFQDVSAAMISNSNSENNKLTFDDYVGFRLLNEEAIASAASDFLFNKSPSSSTLERNNNILVVLADQRDVKFGYGLQERLIRNINNKLSPATVATTSDVTATVNEGNSDTTVSSTTTTTTTTTTEQQIDESKQAKVLSILLNPTPTDTGGKTAQLRLTLAYGSFLKDQRPLSNYLWYSNDPPAKYLTRLKNPISREGDKPRGESSIIKAF